MSRSDILPGGWHSSFVFLLLLDEDPSFKDKESQRKHRLQMRERETWPGFGDDDEEMGVFVGDLLFYLY